MSFYRRLPRFLLPKVLLILSCLLWAGMGPAAVNGKAKGSGPLLIPGEAMDLLIAMDPSIVYPDGQRMADVSGSLTAIFKAQGSYTFRTDYGKKNALITRARLDLTMTIQYTRSGKSELITSAIQGTKTITEDYPPQNDHPGIHRVETSTYSGSEARDERGFALKSLVWSREKKLACFEIGLGPRRSNLLEVPYTFRTEWIDEDGKQSVEGRTQMMAALPSVGTSNTRFAQLVTNGPFQENLIGAWIETASAQGTTNGSFTAPVFFDGGSAWHYEGSFKNSSTNPRQTPESANNIFWLGSVQVIWALGNKMPEGRMTIAAADPPEYADWIPAPIDDERFGPASRLRFTARIEPKEKGKPAAGSQPAPKGKIHFWLCDVSRQKGKCGNYPVDGAAKDGLRFTPDQAGLIIDPQNPLHAYTEKVCDQATVTVEALDTGAYGTLQATCDDLGLIAENERTKLQSIAIPMDDNYNHIADSWEKSIGIYQKNYLAADDDDNQPAGQRRNGDGYTVYEEYRGFMALSGFVRTNPLQKDLFIYDPDGLVKKWYAPYHPTKLVLHYIDPTMMKFNGEAQNPENRWVNCNSSADTWYARQYAMYVKQWTTMTDQVVGEASDTVITDRLNNIAAQGDAFDQPLKKFYIVKIAPGTLEKTLAGIKDPALKQAVYTKVMTTTVIHEMGHAMGIRHHRANGRETDDSVNAGVFDCAMRYNTKAEYQHSELLKMQTRYCGKGEVWKKPVKNGFQDMPSDNCFGQIDVKSDP